MPAINTDWPGYIMPSDHCGVVATPCTGSKQQGYRTKIKKKIRPLPESLLQTFETELMSKNFDLHSDLSVDEMVNRFQNITNDLLCQTFPEKVIIISPEDKPWFTEGLRNLKRRRLREYNKHGRSEKYLQLAPNCDQKFNGEFMKYLEKLNWRSQKVEEVVLTLSSRD